MTAIGSVYIGQPDRVSRDELWAVTAASQVLNFSSHGLSACSPLVSNGLPVLGEHWTAASRMAHAHQHSRTRSLSPPCNLGVGIRRGPDNPAWQPTVPLCVQLFVGTSR